MKPLLIISLVLFFVCSLAACVPHPLGNDPEEEHPLAVTMNVVDGIRTLDKVLRRPELSLTVQNGRDDRVYEALFTINDGAQRSVRSIWNGVPKDLSGELLSFSEYGAISLTGYLVDTAEPTERVPIDTTVWIVYAPALHSAVSVRTAAREETLLPGLVLFSGEKGTLEIDYTPEDTYLHIGITVPEESPLHLLEKSLVHERGHYALPFSVTGSGEATIRVTLENGRESETLEYPVTCKRPDTESVE